MRFRTIPKTPRPTKKRPFARAMPSALARAVNPVLREGNSDRRAPKAVKEYARKNPHSHGRVEPGLALARVAHAQRRLLPWRKVHDAGQARATCSMELITKSGKTIVLKPKVSLLDREVIDSMFMSKKALLEFYEKEIDDAHKTGVMFSLHVKATMMKVSHPIVFGHCVKIFYKDAFAKHAKLFEELGVNVNNGMADLYRQDRHLAAVQAGRNRARSACLP